MSTTSQSTTISSGSSLPSLDPIGGSGGGGQSANYFFGFLITFAVLLLVFVVAGLFSRRRMNARHEAGEIGGGDPWVYVTGPGGDYARRVQPVWVERWIEDPDTAREKEKDVSIDLDGVPERGKWRNIMPLCASLSHPEHETKSETGGDAEKGRRGSVSTVSSWFSNWSTAKPTDTVRDEEHALPEVSTEVLQDPEAKVDIVVMIAMPRGPNSRGYEFGVASVPSNIHKTSGETPTVP